MRTVYRLFGFVLQTTKTRLFQFQLQILLQILEVTCRSLQTEVVCVCLIFFNMFIENRSFLVLLLVNSQIYTQERSERAPK